MPPTCVEPADKEKMCKFDPSPSPTPSPSSLSIGVIVGIAVGGFVLLIIIIAVVTYCIKKARKQVTGYLQVE